MYEERKLKKTPIFAYDECGYLETKDFHFKSFNQYLKSGCTILQCVNGHYYYGFEDDMAENGMDKFVAMIAGMLFMIEHNEVDFDQAWVTNLDIGFFETGEYDDLFTEKDLSLIRADIEIIKNYLSQHPEVLNDK